MISESGRKKMLDALRRGNDTRKKNSLEREKSYNLNPALCIECSGNIPYSVYSSSKNSKNFCSQSCATKYNNNKRAIHCSICGKGYYGHIEFDKEYVCRTCYLKSTGKEKTGEKFFVSPNGSRIRDYEGRIKKLISGEYSDNSARAFYRKLFEIKCSVCGRTEWDGNPIPVTVDHIDGNYKNNRMDNLRFVCRNCEAFLPTFGSKNRGNGRPDIRNRTPKAERSNHNCIICDGELSGLQSKYCSKSCKNIFRNRKNAGDRFSLNQ